MIVKGMMVAGWVIGALVLITLFSFQFSNPNPILLPFQLPAANNCPCSQEITWALSLQCVLFLSTSLIPEFWLCPSSGTFLGNSLTWTFGIQPSVLMLIHAWPLSKQSVLSLGSLEPHHLGSFPVPTLPPASTKCGCGRGRIRLLLASETRTGFPW